MVSENYSQPNLRIKLEQTTDLARHVNSKGTFKITLNPYQSYIENLDDISISVEPFTGLNRKHLEKIDDANYSCLFLFDPKGMERIRYVNISALLKDKYGSLHRFHKLYKMLL